jgi:hypothetical protein
MYLSLYTGVHRGLVTGLLCLQLIACGGGSGDPDEPGSEPKLPGNVGGEGDIFDPTRVLDIDLTLSSSEYDSLRREGRSLAETSRECMSEYEYTDFQATVTIDGTTMRDVSVRKKGFLGSLSSVRPSFKLDFDQFHDDRTYQHETRMTLNNNRQDISNLRQCLAYDLFRDAGLPAPRCNFARVSVNGEALGIYTHVEPIKKPFLARVFGDDDGNLYEAQLSDFGVHLSDRFEMKTNEKENDRGDLAAVAAALDLPDDELIAALSAHLDLDEFIRYWALETLTGTWDSATGNANNFFLYHSPVDDRFHFIPWGADTAFVGAHFLKPGAGPLYRDFRLADRLYSLDTYRAQYFETINDYLDTLWDEAALNAKIDAWAALTGATESDLSALRSFISGAEGVRSQRELLLSAIAGLEPAQTVTVLEDSAPDCTARPTSNLSLDVTSQNNANSGSFQFTLPSGAAVNGWVDLSAQSIDSVNTALDASTQPPTRQLVISGVDLNNPYQPYSVVLLIEEPHYRTGTESFQGFADTIMVYKVDAADPRPETSTLIALGHRGSIQIHSRGSADDDVRLQINGSIEFLSGD